MFYFVSRSAQVSEVVSSFVEAAKMQNLKYSVRTDALPMAKNGIRRLVTLSASSEITPRVILVGLSPVSPKVLF